MSKLLLSINILLLISLWIFTGTHYSGLPDTIPTHFDFHGEVDGQGHKRMIWFLPAIATFIFLLFVSLSRMPNSPMLNVPKEFRKKEPLGIMLFSMLIPLQLLLGSIVMESISVAQNKKDGLSNFSFVLVGMLFVVIGINIFIMYRKKRNEEV
ncbi:DUF1648 domain-containing protein [Chryseobacterium sp.]|uniref:DUF1648 domain-containing protein n=1 Tax=Chryseobacterium sp. TaxID=1871047 RepID=UPI0025B9AA19|nr:DUF1648 domain-containing protein [Chryseobacterium sp.]